MTISHHLNDFKDKKKQTNNSWWLAHCLVQCHERNQSRVHDTRLEANMQLIYTSTVRNMANASVRRDDWMDDNLMPADALAGTLRKILGIKKFGQKILSKMQGVCASQISGSPF